LTHNKVTDNVILFFIFISSLLLSLDNPLNDPNGSLTQALYAFDIIFTVIFAIECSMKIIALGFIANGKKSYLRKGWNVLDFTIVLMSIVSTTITSQKFKIVKIFRLIRVLRPLRLISRNKLLKIAIQALFMALPNIFNVIVVAMLFFVIFGIIAVNYFKGAFYNYEIPND